MSSSLKLDERVWRVANELRERARRDLFEVLQGINGVKDLFIDADLFPLIDLTSNATEIKQCNVDKLHKLESVLNVQTKNKRLFLLRPNMVRFLNLAKQLRQLEIRDAHLICVPRKFYAFEHLLEQEGLWGRCTLHELPAFDMIPFDYDVFSMVNSHLYLSIYLDQSNDWLATLVSSLIDLQKLTGRFSNLFSFGKLAGQVVRQLERTQSSMDIDEFNNANERMIQTVILFDRNIDLVTLFCSQMCYEGLLDEYFNIEGGRIKIPKSSPSEGTQKQYETVLLSTKDDSIIGGIRGTHFSRVFQEIKSCLAKQTSLQEDFRFRLQDASISDMKEMVHKDVKGHLNAKKQITRHLDLSTEIYEQKKANDFKIQLDHETDILRSQNFDEAVSYIHTMIARCEPNKFRPLQLLCLLSTSNNGLPKETYELLCRAFLQAYGYENIPFLYKLEQLGMFHARRPSDMPIPPTNSNQPGFRTDGILKMGKQVAQNLTEKNQTKTLFQFLRKRFNLLPDASQPRTTIGPDMSDVFGSTYVPLSCRLIEEALTNPTKIESVQHELSQRGYPDVGDLFGRKVFGHSTRNHFHDQQNSVLVVFIGGCTLSEINALRILTLSRSDIRFQFYFAPTSIWTHQRILEEIERSQ